MGNAGHVRRYHECPHRGRDTHIESVIATKPLRPHDRLLTVAAVDRNYGSATECHPGSGFHPSETIPSHGTDLTGGTTELCVRGPNLYYYGYLPRVFWDIPYPQR
ncbi:hypothetical protein [Nocardia sp. XZ_19_369]|uniref:hypothetical protein n=1 Tax=Nocardia sp. XZ_19_369 TaxID=2769487 RepID=UPI00188E6E3A|nr:hypothetical protein [Nocardia sp. XZ_19_369]